MNLVLTRHYEFDTMILRFNEKTVYRMGGKIMLFDMKDTEFSIVDVLKLERYENKNASTVCNGRPISILSCRFSGSTEINVDGKILKPAVNQYFLCPAYTKYTQVYHTEELIAIHLEFSKNPPQKPEVIPCMLPEVRESFSKLYAYWSQKKPGYLYKCKSIVYNILYLLCKANQNDANIKIKKSMDYLYTNFRQTDFSIEKMIGLSYLSQAYFRRIFFKQYGCSIVDFVNRLRIEYAKSLLESKELRIKEIASMAGFKDEKYFSQVFKKLTGYTPTEYC